MNAKVEYINAREVEFVGSICKHGLTTTYSDLCLMDASVMSIIESG